MQARSDSVTASLTETWERNKARNGGRPGLGRVTVGLPEAASLNDMTRRRPSLRPYQKMRNKK
jgi:hypothetical protein